MLPELRSPIAVHHTDTTDAAWDGPANVARCPSERGPLRALHAWVDVEGDGDAKASYKFPHHLVSAGGDVGAAATRACSAGIAVLNGGRGGSDIPESDRQGVYRHLAAHLRDAGMEPPALRSAGGGIERRAYDFLELRIDASGTLPMIRGHAAVFDQPSEELGLFMPFREKVAKGAFKKTIKEGDVRALFNHNADFVLGRNKANTLRLHEDDIGLSIEATPPHTQWARDLMTSMERGDINQMSFGFQVVRDTWEHNTETKEVTRTLNEVRLFDVSVVTFPAYPQTDAAVRALLSECGIDYDALSRVAARCKAGDHATVTDTPLLSATLDALRALMPEPEPHHDDKSPEVHHSPAIRRRQIELLELELAL